MDPIWFDLLVNTSSSLLRTLNRLDSAKVAKVVDVVRESRPNISQTFTPICKIEWKDTNQKLP